MTKNRDLAFKDYINGMKYKDIAKKYHVSINTVKSWHSRYWKNSNRKSSHSSKKVAHNHTKVAHKVAPVINVAELQKSGLTPKRQNFCLLYVKYYNATKAYKLAYGSSVSTAQTNGWLLLQNTAVQHEITRIRQKQINKLHFNRFDVLRKLIEIYNTDPGDMVHFGHETDVDQDGNKYQRPYLYFRQQRHVDTSCVDEIKMGQNGADIKVAPKLQVAKLLMQYLSDPINRNTQKDTLVQAFMKGLRKSNHKSNENKKSGDDDHN